MQHRQSTRTGSCDVALPIDAMLRASWSRPHGRSLARTFKSTLMESQQSLQSFPRTMQNIVTQLQEQFDRRTNSDGLFELYGAESTEKMWKTSMKRNSKNDVMTGSTDSLNSTYDTTEGDNKSKMVKQAGVLVLLVLDDDDDDLSIVFTRRSKHLSSHASEISFPGGHYEEANDATIIDTAIRESVEELYDSTNHNIQADDIITTEEELFRQNLYIFGSTTAVPSLRGIPVTSVLGIYHTDQRSRNESITQLWPGNPSEVELVFTVQTSALIQAHRTQSNVDIAMVDRAATKSESQSPQYPTSHGTIWGLTAYILQPIVQKILLPFVENKTSE